MTAREWIARHLYSDLLRVLKPLYVARLWWRGRAEPMYRHNIRERLGDYEEGTWTGGVWVHAVSLGETRAAATLIDALRARQPGVRILLTHSTATGREAGKALMREGDAQAWLPYDTPGVVRRFFTVFRPAVGVLMETEVWPNLLHAAENAKVPMVLANARLSARSYEKGQRLAAVIHPAVTTLALVLAQTEQDAQRLRDSGASNVHVCGNLKFDIAPDEALLERGRAWREALQRPVVLGAVTRESEEAMLLHVWMRLPADGRPLLSIVPRHPQRFDEVAELVKSKGLTLVRRSQWAESPNEAQCGADVWLGDTMGEMPLYYAAADVALLGGSFAPLGGQNLIEAAACGCPVVMGPHTFNFADAARLSIDAGASVRVADMNEGVGRALEMLREDVRAMRSQCAVAFAEKHRGAAGRMAELVERVLKVPSPSDRAT